MKERAESVSSARRSRGEDPVLVEEGIPDDVGATIFACDVRQGQGKRILTVLKHSRFSAT
jgi:hypothetical protein